MGIEVGNDKEVVCFVGLIGGGDREGTGFESELSSRAKRSSSPDTVGWLGRSTAVGSGNGVAFREGGGGSGRGSVSGSGVGLTMVFRLFMSRIMPPGSAWLFAVGTSARNSRSSGVKASESLDWGFVGRPAMRPRNRDTTD